jgi:hypothetical protein
MKPKRGQIWFGKATKKYVLIAQVYKSTVDFEYIHSNVVTWCDLQHFKAYYELVSG